MTDDFDPALDLKLERTVPVRPATIWRCWTEPELLKRWFCPRPWRLAEVEMDLRPGGRFDSVMEGPNGERHASKGCYLIVEPERRLVFTDTMTEGFRPSGEPFFTGFVTIASDGEGARYVAIARHGRPETKTQHEEMGFHDGWGTALDQLVEVARELEAAPVR
jgi:uncharacterized protein YndB with AHSA1/START domain